jgi:hypothetical protein
MKYSTGLIMTPQRKIFYFQHFLAHVLGNSLESRSSCSIQPESRGTNSEQFKLIYVQWIIFGFLFWGLGRLNLSP